MIKIYNLLITCSFLGIVAYRNNMYTISAIPENIDLQCCERSEEDIISHVRIDVQPVKLKQKWGNVTNVMPSSKSLKEEDPLLNFQRVIRQFLFGKKTGSTDKDSIPEEDVATDSESMIKLNSKGNNNSNDNVDHLVHFPTGNVMRAELFHNKPGVHMLPPELLHRGHCRLNVTSDLMQTAVNAFSILLYGNLRDVMSLPADYVLNSARSIAMMKISREKLSATWSIVKGDNPTGAVTSATLEKYRPLFKYVNGREMASLNLSDDKILTYIGTHPDLNRHQVGVVASRYIQLNPRWSEPRYLNLMNNLICGVPMSYMRRIDSNTYLQLTHQLFYHIRACDPLQRRFYLGMMTKTAALGKSYSWSARDVARLGLLLTEVDGPQLASINPEAMAGITAQVMLEIPPQSLQYITEVQLRYLGQKPSNILARRINVYKDELRLLNSGHRNYF